MRHLLIAVLGLPLMVGFLMGVVGLGAYLATRAMEAFHLDPNDGGMIFSVVFVVATMVGMGIFRLLKQAI
jgi:hypothetical protein